MSGSLDVGLSEPSVICEEIHYPGGICWILELHDSVHSHVLEVSEKFTLELNKSCFSFVNLVSKPLLHSQKPELSSIGWIWEDCWGSAVLLQVGLFGSEWSSHPSCECIRLLICTRPPMMGFVGWKMVCMGEVLVAVAEPEPVEVILCSSTINWVGHICWVLGSAWRLA